MKVLTKEEMHKAVRDGRSKTVAEEKAAKKEISRAAERAVLPEGKWAYDDEIDKTHNHEYLYRKNKEKKAAKDEFIKKYAQEVADNTFDIGKLTEDEQAAFNLWQDEIEAFSKQPQENNEKAVTETKWQEQLAQIKQYAPLFFDQFIILIALLIALIAKIVFICRKQLKKK